MTAASRRSLNELPRQAPRSCEGPMLVKQGTGLRASFRGRSRATGSGMPSSTASHRKNCCSPRSWPRAQASLYKASSRTVHLVPPGLASLPEQVRGGEPQRRPGVGPDGTGRLVLRRRNDATSAANGPPPAA
jgi:hypothetical protein